MVKNTRELLISTEMTGTLGKKAKIEFWDFGAMS